MGRSIHCKKSIAQWFLLSHRRSWSAKEQGGQVRRWNQKAMECGTASSLLYLGEEVHVSSLELSYVGCFCRLCANNKVVWFGKLTWGLSLRLSLSIILRWLAWYPEFISEQVVFTRKKSTLRLCCCLKTQLMASKRKGCMMGKHERRIKTKEKRESALVFCLTLCRSRYTTCRVISAKWSKFHTH